MNDVDVDLSSTHLNESEMINIDIDNNNNSYSISQSSPRALRILMVSPEYPPINGGVGRYTYNLVQELKRQGIDVYVACDKKGKGQFVGLSPTNIHNSEILLSLVDEIKPDIVHIQYEPGLYGLKMDSYRPASTHTTIDLFYAKATIPIVTTFHSGYTFRQWMRIPEIIINKKESLLVTGKNVDNKKHVLLSNLKNRLENINIYWKYLTDYRAFQHQNKEKLLKSNAGIVFSEYMRVLISGKRNNKQSRNKVWIIYHGAEPAIPAQSISKIDARSRFPSIPQGVRDKIALAIGFMTVAKGWDILKKMKVPENWTIVVSASRNYSTDERIQLGSLGRRADSTSRIINLDKDYLSEEDLSALFYASDTVLLPYKISSGSGVMFDAFGHGIPFIASDLPFFNEFAAKGVGITAQRTPNAFTTALIKLDNNYNKYKKAVEDFKKNLRWNLIARNHIELYHDIVRPTKMLKNNEAAATIVNNPQDQLQSHCKNYIYHHDE
jgi:glycosyltransferase involved in cell wall biosynthesis